VLNVFQDLRYSCRLLKRSPAFTVFAVVILALGIGASTTMFAIVNAVLLEPLPFQDPQRLVTIRPDSGARMSERYVYAWHAQSRTTIGVAGWYDERMILSGGGEPLEVSVDRTTPNFFTVLGTPPLLGRTFSYDQNLEHSAREVVLGYSLWQCSFHGRVEVIGQSITLDGQPFDIVGVMPAGFAIRTNELPESRAELWVPFRIHPADGVGMGGALNAIARLAGNSSPEQARVDLATIANRLEAELPSFTRNWRVQVLPLREATVRDVRSTLIVLFGSVGILLLITSINVATLSLSRTSARSTEVAIRMSLGATRTRVVRQSASEGLLLTACGGSLGVLLARWGTGLAIHQLPPVLDLPRVGQISVDTRTLAFALVVTMITAIAFGVLAAMPAVRLASHDSLRKDISTTSPPPGRRRVADALLIAQIALALTLLVAAGLLTRSFENLTRVDLGFTADHVMTMRTTLSPLAYSSDDRKRNFVSEVLTRAAASPGITAVGLANYLPLTNVGEGTAFEIEGRTYVRPDEQPGSWRSIVGGQYFEAMGIPLLRGRFPTSADTRRTDPIAIIDDVLARRYWPNANPVGSRLLFKDDDGVKRSVVIIGIVGNVRWMATAASPPGTTYLWFPQRPGREITLIARVSGNARASAKALARTVTDIDPTQPVSDIRSLNDIAAADLARPRVTMLMLAAFAAAAMVLAAVGLYAVILFGVLRRTREIGVRIALGAQRHDLLRLFMTRGLVATAIGVLVGLECSLVLGRVTGALLYGVSPRDPWSTATAVLTVVAVAAVATYLPASRATRLDSIVALRRE